MSEFERFSVHFFRFSLISSSPFSYVIFRDENFLFSKLRKKFLVFPPPKISRRQLWLCEACRRFLLVKSSFSTLLLTVKETVNCSTLTILNLNKLTWDALRYLTFLNDWIFFLSTNFFLVFLSTFLLLFPVLCISFHFCFTFLVELSQFNWHTISHRLGKCWWLWKVEFLLKTFS